MSVFVFDQETIRIIRYLLALQSFSDYSVGPQGLDEYLCTETISRVLIQTGQKFPKFQKETPREISVNEVIRFLEQKNQIPFATAQKLREYMDLYDSLISVNSQVSPKKNNSKVQEMLQFLCFEAGLDQNEELKNRTFEEIATLKTIQPFANENYEKLVESDFDNFDRLYQKCPAVKMEIEKKLISPMQGVQMSAFTPYTGGIWLPFVAREKNDNRAHVERASVGVTFTPVDIRIGLNFGSRAHKYLKKYYGMLLNEELMSEFESLNRKDTGYCLCDTFWNYHIRNVQSIQWCLTLYGSTKISLENAIEEVKQLEGTPLTTSRYLISKVIKRSREDFTYVLNGIAVEISKTLDELYPTIERINKAET